MSDELAQAHNGAEEPEGGGTPEPLPKGDLTDLVGADLDALPSAGSYFARYGTFMLAAPCDTPRQDKLMKRLEDALNADTRIKTISEIKFRKEWIARRTSYPAAGDSSSEDLLSGRDHFHSIHFSDPVTFSVVVPERNQPSFKGYRDIPTDTYFVSWDGVTVVVVWQRQSDDDWPPRAGGQVVAEILQDVATRAGLDLYVQPCSPGCQNLFAHRVLRINQVSIEGPVVIGEDDDLQVLDVLVAAKGGGIDVARALGGDMKLEGELFARFKNGARRALDLEAMARELVDELLELQYARNLRRTLRPLARLRSLWGARGSTKRTQQLIASLWLAFARLEALRSGWFPIRDRFIETADRYGTSPYYRMDQKDDDRAVTRQDLNYIRAAVEQSASRLDARMIALFTALGAVAGFVGGLVGTAFS